MRKSHQPLNKEIQNQYGLQFRSYKGLKQTKKNIQITDQNINLQNTQKVQVYIKTDEKKCMKMQFPKKCKLQKFKQFVEKRLSIPLTEQLIYLNGKDITEYNSINIHQKQIFHITNKKNIANENNFIQLTLKVSFPNEFSLNKTLIECQIESDRQIESLEELVKKAIQQNINQKQLVDRFDLSFMESGRILDKNQSFKNNKLPLKCQITCIVSEYQIQTRFQNQLTQDSEKTHEKVYSYKRIQNSQQNKNESCLKASNSNIRQLKQLESQSKHTSNQKFRFNPQRVKQNHTLYSKIAEKKHNNRQITKHKSQYQANKLPLTGFKKKKSMHENIQVQDNSNLLKSIVIHKCKSQIQKIMSQGSMMKEQEKQDDEEKKSIVSQSSQEENKYVPIRQQKEYRPCPLIPQRKMGQNQKLKINMQLQRLFGFEPKKSSQPKKEQQQKGNSQQQLRVQAQQTTRSRVVVRNQNMRSSISAKQSMMRLLKDRKPNRYAEQSNEDVN